MALLVELGVVAVTLLVLWQLLTYKKRRALPPGDYGWPIIGRIPPLNKPMTDFISGMRKKFGDVFTWKVGNFNVVVLCEYKTIRRIFSMQETQDRPNFLSFNIIKQSNNMGIFNVCGDNFLMSRRFTVRHLRDMGLGRTVMEDAIAFEAEQLVKDFKSSTNKPTLVPLSLNIAALNIIWKLTADKRYDLSNKKIQETQSLVLTILDQLQGNVMLFDMFPYLLPFTPNFIYKWLGVTEYENNCKKYKNFMRTVVEENKKTLDPDHPRDLIDFFLIENMKEEHKGDDAYTDENVIVTVGDIFLASSETTSSTIRWILLYLAKYPEIQAKIHAELDRAVPRDRLPGLQDKDKLNYLLATCHDIERIITFVPFAFVHYTNSNINIDGYNIAKNTVLLAHLAGCHNDPNYWEKPDQLYPEHFLDDEGKFKMKREGFLPFSIGRRVCPGENLARQAIFQFVSALLQAYTFSAPEGATISTARYQTERLINVITPQNLIIRERP